MCSTPICPFCEEPILSGPTEQFGGLLLHADCYREFGVELSKLDEPNSEVEQPNECF